MLLKSVLLKSRNLVEMASMELFHRQPLVEKVGGAQSKITIENMEAEIIRKIEKVQYFDMSL